MPKVYGEITWESEHAPDQPKRSFGSRPTPYATYAGIDTLHELGRPRTDEPAEVSFIVATQVMELLFGLLAHEWLLAQRALRADDLPAAMDALGRGLRVQDVLVGSWELLATMTPMEFEAFRAELGEGSGFQSAAYRRLEFMLGNKAPGMVKLQKGSPRAYEELAAALREPALYDDVLALLGRRGLPVPDTVLKRDLTRPYQPHPGVERAWRAVYTGTEGDLIRLAELLVDVAERVARWRQRHYMAVRRTLGAKPGTGGSSGLDWLRKAVDRDAFPELWTVRNAL